MEILAMILAGGRGSRLDILSEKRVKPSVPFAGKFRIIDFNHMKDQEEVLGIKEQLMLSDKILNLLKIKILNMY